MWMLYFRNDLNLIRFLRGAEGRFEEAASKLRYAIDFRAKNAKRLAEVQALFPDPFVFSLSHVWKANQILSHLPILKLQGKNKDGLHVFVNTVRLLDPSSWTPEIFDVYDDFILGLLELRSAALHEQSMAEHRMAKFVEIRDFLDVSIPILLVRSMQILKKIGQVMGKAQDAYPEQVHYACIINTTSNFSQLWDFVKPVLNERMRSKVRVFQVGVPMSDISREFNFDALHSLLNIVPEKTLVERCVLAGSVAYWCHQVGVGTEVSWKIRLVHGSAVLCRILCITGALVTNCDTLLCKELSSKNAEVSGKITSCELTLIVMMVDNSASYFRSQTVVVNLS
eukprot:gnl/MRDRNA2_/MRDRNA2_24432_c0_seq2.p1 gnl/MRDRNA2_/MRDRNA2_24432_c0~~gnl/MRDRNA2_/MRDRNA2_24432_c0_seq2.p1  ORF type:complete len:339 (+),score=52.39 gnl/MRDRNA2_/MRDRNA2_24432_c0_seq2:339-1355(+)